MDKQSPFIADVLLRVSHPRLLAEERVSSIAALDLFLATGMGRLQDSIMHPGVVKRSWLEVRDRLVELAALACRAARDLEIEGAADAVSKDIPF